MIVKTIVVTIIFSIGILRGVTGASYSNVYVERNIAPRGYYRYAPYTSLPDPRISQITSLPAITEYGAPCGSPCVFPAQAVSSVVAPVNPSPNVIAYSAPVPSVPVLVTPPKEAANGYEYSYAVYDENTGDHKAQRELSDGSVVRGEYSFIQPDGYVREVQYVADDISGFNAVVKNFLPAIVEGKKKDESVVKIESSPPLNVDCHEIKSEPIKQGSNENSEAVTEQLFKIHENLHEELSKEGSAENSKEISNEHVNKPVSEEESKASSNEDHSLDDHSKEEKHSKEESVEKTADKSNEVHDITPAPSEEQSSDASAEKSKENPQLEQLEPELPKEESSEKSKQENSHSKESGPKSEEKEDITTKPASSESGEESVSKESKEELKEISKKKATINSGEKINDNKHKEIFDLLQPPQEAVVPYHDIIRCIQAAMSRSYGVPPAVNDEHSPLTYIVLNKPC